MFKTAKRKMLIFVYVTSFTASLALNASAQDFRAGFSITAEKVATFLKSRPNSALCGGFLAGGLAYAFFYYNRCQKIKFPLSTLLDEPDTALENAMRVKEEFGEECAFSNTPVQDIKDRLAVFERKSPIFLLGECADGRFCELARFAEPEYRKVYENHVVRALADKMRTHSDTVHYASFASGGMFQDLVILAKAFNQKPDGSLAIHLIDIQYKAYVDFCKAAQEAGCASFDVTTFALRDFTTEEKKAIGQSIRPKSPEQFESKSDEQVFDKIYRYAFFLAQAYRQLITFLQQNFPQAHISLNVYSGKDAYLTYLDEHNVSYPDIIVAADFQDEMSFIKRAVQHYEQLCQSVLEKMPEMQNIALCLSREHTAALVSYSLQPQQPSADEEETEEQANRLRAEKTPISLFASRARAGIKCAALVGAAGLGVYGNNKYVRDSELKDSIYLLCGGAYLGWVLPYFYNRLTT